MQQAGAYVEAHESEVAGMVAKFGGIDPATMPAKINHPGRRVVAAPDPEMGFSGQP